MTYEELMVAHLATVIPSAVLGLGLFAMPKGTRLHRATGKAYVALMLLTAVISLFMHPRAGPVLFGHWGFIHLFSFLTLLSLPVAVLAARMHQIAIHKTMMILAFAGAIGVAGWLAIKPGRYLHQVFAGNW